MSQHDYVIDNASGATVRADINSALGAIQSLNSGTSAPSSTAAGMLWLDTTGGAPYALKVRDAGNNHWLTLASVTDPGSDGNLSVAAIEGTSVISTGESGGNKFLREDGDGTCSWQTPEVLQVVQDIKPDKQAITGSTSSTTFADISGLEASLTPSSTSNKILVIASLMMGASNYQNFVKLRAKTGSGSYADVSGALGTDSTDASQTKVWGMAYGHGGDDAGATTTTLTYLDSPNTTSARTYTVQACNRYNGICTINYPYANNNDFYIGQGISVLTIMEIAG